MSLTLPLGTRTAMATTLTARFDAGSGPGVIQIRSGSRPASADTAAAGTLLASFTLNDPAFESVTNGVATIDSTPNPAATGLTDGTASWFRGLDSDGNTVCDGSVTATGGGGDLTLNTVSVTTGVALAVTGGTVTQPAG